MKKIFDFHTHVFPKEIARKAGDSISDFYEFPRENAKDGTIETLIDIEKKAGIQYFATCSTATSASQVKSINNWISTLKTDNIFPFGTLHPDYTDIEQEVGRILSLGLYGIKLHPDFQKFNIDGSRAKRIYKAVGDKLPILIHTGDPRYDFSAPSRLAKMLEEFPSVRFVAPHLGGYTRWDEALNTIIGKNIWLDISSSLYFLEKEKAVEIIRKHGADKVFFGSDYPISEAEKDLELLYSLNLTKNELDDILWNNAIKFLNLKI